MLNNIAILSRIVLHRDQITLLKWPIITLTINNISLCIAELYYWEFPHLLFETDQEGENVETETYEIQDSLSMVTTQPTVTAVET